MGQTRKKIQSQKKKNFQPFCHIPMPAAALNYSSHDRSHASRDFYDWVNHEWISTVHVPPFENDFGVSEEVERCVFNKSVEILESTKEKMLIDRKNSFLNEEMIEDMRKISPKQNTNSSTTMVYAGTK